MLVLFILQYTICIQKEIFEKFQPRKKKNVEMHGKLRKEKTSFCSYSTIYRHDNDAMKNLCILEASTKKVHICIEAYTGNGYGEEEKN